MKILKNRILIFLLVSLGSNALAAEKVLLETAHFQICETKPGAKVAVKYGHELTSPEFECLSTLGEPVRAREISDDKLIMSCVTGHGSGFHQEKLFLAQVIGVSDEKMPAGKSFKILSFSNEKFFAQARDKTKFEMDADKVKVFIDGKKLAEFTLPENNDTNAFENNTRYTIDYCDENFSFDLRNTPKIKMTIASKQANTAYPEFIGDISFNIVYFIEQDKLGISLETPS